MISLILPYWNRQAAADEALELLYKNYRDTDLEIVVVDDGSEIPFKAPSSGLNIKVVRLPTKKGPKCPATVWNAGVLAASGDLIALSCIEILHTVPVLERMAEQVAQMGPDGYVLAAAWCPEQKVWHCHSSVDVPDCPKGSGIAFLGMMHRELFNRAGGFGAEYRDGAGYEDRDFIRKVWRAGGKFLIRDDLVVTHPKRGASIQWPDGAFQRNEAIYRKAWEGDRKPVTFLCLKAGKAYGPEYVNTLFDMVRRNLVAGYPGRFVCLTDDPTGLDAGIETIRLPGNIETWWGKLYMFKRGLFNDGERVIFMDLDTLIIGDLGPLVAYDGQFATLRDFYFPQQVGPAIIAWEAGAFAASIWEEWDAQGRPRDPGGDLWWINNLDQGRFPKTIDILQDNLPGYFCSFKADCHPYPPKGTAVVCFHGQPKPDNCATPWVDLVWKVGGSGMAELDAVCNVEQSALMSNVTAACKRPLPWLDLIPEHQGQAVIVGGGPSLRRTLPEIQWRKSIGQTIIAVNGAARFLNANGIKPDVHVVIDARPENAEFLKSPSDQQFIASQCASEIFAAASNPVLFHMNIEGIERAIPDDRVAHLISSGTTVGLAAMAIAYTQGYRAIHLHGFDSSFDPAMTERHHAYRQTRNDGDAVIDATVEGKTFKSSPWMVKQVQQFQELALQLADAGVVITVAGDGLLPFVAQQMGKSCN